MGAQFSEWKTMRKTLWQDNRDIGKEKMWPLEHNSEKMEGKAEKEEEDVQDRTKHFIFFMHYRLVSELLSFVCRLCAQ